MLTVIYIVCVSLSWGISMINQSPHFLYFLAQLIVLRDFYYAGAGNKGNGKAPTFVSKPKIQQGDNSLILKCQVDCSPAPQVTQMGAKWEVCLDQCASVYFSCE